MNVDALVRQFAKIGAELEVDVRPALIGAGARQNFTLDIRQEARKEFYLLEVARGAAQDLDFQVLNARRDLRHLVLMAKPFAESPTKEKFLCGHDERHWFVAALASTTPVIDVVSAMESLKPMQAAEAQRRLQVPAKERNLRRNDGFIRQGEWFFVPAPEFQPRGLQIILRDEPLSRGWGSKPHIVEELIRFGGEQVYVHRISQQVLTEFQYRKRLSDGKLKDKGNWQVRRLTASVFVRGKVRHADHKTITLPGWHRVAMNVEARSANVRFLD